MATPQPGPVPSAASIARATAEARESASVTDDAYHPLSPAGRGLGRGGTESVYGRGRRTPSPCPLPAGEGECYDPFMATHETILFTLNAGLARLPLHRPGRPNRFTAR